MLIEVIQPRDDSTTEKGNLLEKLSEKFLKTQGYDVTRQVRITASELDLLCKHKTSGREIYVESKAQRDSLSANVLTNLLGTITFHNYNEGWLISTGPLGKDARGFLNEWEKKPQNERNKLSFYTPERIIEALIDAKLIHSQPNIQMDKTKFSIGDWMLIISPYGEYWACPVLSNGIPRKVLLYNATNGSQVIEQDIYDKFKTTDFSLREMEFINIDEKNKPIEWNPLTKDSVVIEVEYGEKWFDYRPSRPEHFVGRKKAQKEILQLFSRVKKHTTETRVFAIKGDSGIGKSSLIAKMREMATKSQKPSKLFLYAVDMRAANDASYIYSALVKCLKSASDYNFGLKNKLEITNFTDPLRSESIDSFMSECRRKGELIILVFDQFEELYSKPELFSVFEEAKRLMFSVISASTNIVLGFAWKTDSSIPQNHPAYHLWHQLSDHRFEVTLKPFTHSDAEQSLNIFEKELEENIQPELRKYLLENCQGYPWLLKKLCIHFYEKLKGGTSQHQLANRSLDIASLFDQDMNKLTKPEIGCLRLVAKNAPMDWYDVLEIAGQSVVQSLQNKYLLIRRGDKLNLYWDIFRDYVLNNTIPSIPFTYIPQSTSLPGLLKVCLELDDVEPRTLKEISDKTKLEESTIRNITHDLERFGIVKISENSILIDSHFGDVEARSILTTIRAVLKRHALTEMLKKNNVSKPANVSTMIDYLKSIKPTAQYHIRTWKTYAKKMEHWLHVSGLISRTSNGVRYEDHGDIISDDIKKRSRERKRIIFFGDASPAKVIEALSILKEGPKTQICMMNRGYRNACAVLYRFGIIELSSAGEYRVPELSNSIESSIQLVWNQANNEETLKIVINMININSTITRPQIGENIAKHFQRDWKPASWKRVGNALLQWAKWLKTPLQSDGSLPIPPGRSTNKLQNEDGNVFDFYDNVKTE